MQSDTFSRCHPAVNFLYFTLVLVFSMFFMHPVSLAVSLVSACVYAVLLGGRKALRFQLRWMLPLMLLVLLIGLATFPNFKEPRELWKASCTALRRL